MSYDLTPGFHAFSVDSALLERWKKAMQNAIDQAARYRGATCPNPPVGAVLLDQCGNSLSVGAHEYAGGNHAEVNAIENARRKGVLEQAHTLIVTLEPCSHTGKTPPCTEAILKTSVKTVIVGCEDPNPLVQSRGVERLLAAGVQVGVNVLGESLHQECLKLVAPFQHWVQTGRPWVTVKRAINREGTMYPPPGQKTFTGYHSLKLAHCLRRRADAILTGSGTVLKDWPEFTVRLVQDHPQKKRWLTVLDRRGRVPEVWFENAKRNRFQILESEKEESIEEILNRLGKKGVLEVLVESGPSLSSMILESPFWNEEVRITQGLLGRDDQVEIFYRDSEKKEN